MQDIISLTRDIIALIKDQQVEAAERLVTEATLLHLGESGRVRTEAINTINIELSKIKRQRDILRQTVQALPEKEQLFAEVQIEAVINRIFTDEIAGLKERKRVLSRPG